MKDDLKFFSKMGDNLTDEEGKCNIVTFHPVEKIRPQCFNKIEDNINSSFEKKETNLFSQRDDNDNFLISKWKISPISKKIEDKLNILPKAKWNNLKFEVK